MEIEGTDAIFLEKFEDSLNKTTQTNITQSLHFKQTPEDPVAASINFVVPTAMPAFMYDGSDDPTGNTKRITREELIDSLPDTLVENLSIMVFEKAIDKAISVMGDKVDFFKGKVGGLYVSSPQLIMLIVDEGKLPK